MLLMWEIKKRNLLLFQVPLSPPHILCGVCYKPVIADLNYSTAV
jgi:hypothetical protein